MNRTGLFIALGLIARHRTAVRDLSRTRPEAGGIVLRSHERIVSAEAERACRLRARRRDVDRLGAGAAGAGRHRREAGAAGPADAGSRTRGGVSAGHCPALRRRAHQPHLQELLGPAAAGGGDAVQRRPGSSCRGGIRAATCGRNCSFFSGEGATAFWTYAPAALTPPAWRPLAYVAATVFGVVTSVLRMAFGGHFFTDVAAAGLVSFFVIWLAYAWIYRWPSTRLTGCAGRGRRWRAGLARIPPVAALARARGGLADPAWSH